MSINTFLESQEKPPGPPSEHYGRVANKFISVIMAWLDPKSSFSPLENEYEMAFSSIMESAFDLWRNGEVTKEQSEAFVRQAILFANKMGSYHDPR